jgi:hypothetical protein
MWTVGTAMNCDAENWEVLCKASQPIASCRRIVRFFLNGTVCTRAYPNFPG